MLNERTRAQTPFGATDKSTAALLHIHSFMLKLIANCRGHDMSVDWSLCLLDQCPQTFLWVVLCLEGYTRSPKT